jgi:hypothetical protein
MIVINQLKIKEYVNELYVATIYTKLSIPFPPVSTSTTKVRYTSIIIENCNKTLSFIFHNNGLKIMNLLAYEHILNK